MSADDASRWDARYADAELAEPSPPDALVAADRSETDRTRKATLLDLVPVAGRALDVACGAGAQTAWLAARGLEVVALDASPVAIDLTARTADAAGVRSRVEARVVDLDLGIPTDLGTFDVIVCQRFRAVDLYDSFVERLRPGGLAVVTVLSRTGADHPGAFHAPSGELRTAFTRPDTDVLFHQETAGQESVVLRRHPT
ncbi:class I SAM-dependent methyltransferase [Ilumatobacter nonamiensis]|uniref:class I SAM-dependent methyltransferase n=1 Tax=Ilumatobacter nonamiensis TaxID=467093 RepID=UPI0003450F9D|nr:class I SAM-dependent methyltransferase [Ilumatobacter nonamiensis]